MARYTLPEHTGELELYLEAATLPELFAEAARALAEIMAGPAAEASGGSRHGQAVELEAPDRNALLVDWLNELIYLAERDKRIYGEAQIDEVGPGSLRATVLGHEVDELRLPVKAATLHQLDIREGPEGLRAHVVLDV